MRSGWRQQSIQSDVEVLDLFRNAEYSHVPVVRINDVPGLKSARLFPKAHKLRVIVWPNDHPPPHVHAKFLNGSPEVRIGWPSLEPLRGERTLSGAEQKVLRKYLKQYQPAILSKLRLVFDMPNLSPAIA